MWHETSVSYGPDSSSVKVTKAQNETIITKRAAPVLQEDAIFYT